jgi:hypothetical protein
MSFSLVLTLAAAMGALQPDSRQSAVSGEGAGALVASAEVTVRILPPVILKSGKLVFPQPTRAPHAQVRRATSRVTYEFE